MARQYTEVTSRWIGHPPSKRVGAGSIPAVTAINQGPAARWTSATVRRWRVKVRFLPGSPIPSRGSMDERQNPSLEDAGSIPAGTTNEARLAQSAEAPVSKTGGSAFESRAAHQHASVTQWQRTRLLSGVMGVRLDPGGTNQGPYSSVAEQPPRTRPTAVRSRAGAPVPISQPLS